MNRTIANNQLVLWCRCSMYHGLHLKSEEEGIKGSAYFLLLYFPVVVLPDFHSRASLRLFCFVPSSSLKTDPKKLLTAEKEGVASMSIKGLREGVNYEPPYACSTPAKRRFLADGKPLEEVKHPKPLDEQNSLHPAEHASNPARAHGTANVKPKHHSSLGLQDTVHGTASAYQKTPRFAEA